ncbi:rrm-containing protein [Salpingoeca rosetta]|uniref:Rrm-containing protein n=1 Tax=Salpingoeca rosetta (strain ATCC 50818 / BSB-021) TaxID=946362 RepID=F2U6Y8_SALR5|nr:rrm-containing protein [Salpingoeca rosetta]EGD83620.1 rrm-containing protein [Salpingoeca rosetta]|eukprot:XP_004995124.1 rrm-containing protein [Salpingoeca rosetta]
MVPPPGPAGPPGAFGHPPHPAQAPPHAAAPPGVPGIPGGVPAVPGVPAGEDAKKKQKKKHKPNRQGGGEKWYDPTLDEWDPNDFRIFCGDLGSEVSDEALARAFSKYPSFQKAKIVRDRSTRKPKGFGFVSFKDGKDYLRALKEMNGKYVGNRPVKLRKSTWKDRNVPKQQRHRKHKGKGKASS